MRHRPKLTPQQRERLETYVAVCRRTQGEYRFAHHGPGSWATTYGDEFLDAATEIFRLYHATEKEPPIPPGRGTRYILTMMFDWIASLFRSANVRSCRGASMDRETVRYLYEVHVHRRIHNHNCVDRNASDFA